MFSEACSESVPLQTREFRRPLQMHESKASSLPSGALEASLVFCRAESGNPGPKVPVLEICVPAFAWPSSLKETKKKKKEAWSKFDMTGCVEGLPYEPCLMTYWSWDLVQRMGDAWWLANSGLSCGLEGSNMLADTHPPFGRPRSSSQNLLLSWSLFAYPCCIP